MSNFSAIIQQGALVLLLAASGILATSTSTSTSSSLESDTRFPPRDYSFDPRPNIDPSFLIPLETLNESSNAKTSDSDAGNAVPNGRRNINITSRESEDGLALENKESAHDTELEEGPRAIVHVQTQNFSGEVSYIIHPDNLPPPVFKPMEDLPQLSHSQWRPDLFMKLCCSPDNETVTSETSANVANLTSRSSTSNDTSFLESDEENRNKQSDNMDDIGDTGSDDNGGFLELSEVTPVENSSENVDGFKMCEDGDLENCKKSTNDLSSEDDIASTQLPASEGQGQVEPSATSERSANLTDLLVGLEALGDVANKHLIDASSNHTPRYEESSSSTYQDMFNFLKDIANSDGFQNAFLGDLISNFGSLDENAMKLIYSLLIRPLEAAQQGSKKDRIGAAPENKPDNVNHLPFPFGQNFFMLNKDKLPLRDEPANGYNPFLVPPPRKSPTIRPHAQMHPSPAMQASDFGPSDNAWLPTRSMPRNPSKGLRGDEGVDVITAPPFQNFEVVLGSSLNHEGNKPRVGEWEESQSQPSRSSSQHPLPFNKLRLGLEMPPPDALDALPPGSVLIPPSYVLKQAKLPQIVNKKDGTPGLEIPLSDFLPNLPFRPNDNKSQRLQPPAKPQAHEIPPRLPSFLSILSSAMSHPKPQKSNPVRQRPINRNAFVQRRPPTGPPPPITKLTPPTAKIPTRRPGASYHTPPSPTFTPPPLHNHAPFAPRQPVDNGAPNVLPNSLNPSGLGAAGPISVPVFVSVPPKKPVSAGNPPVQPVAEHTASHDESSNQDLVLKRGDAQGPETIHPVYVDYSDESNGNKSNINYQDHQYYGDLSSDYELDYYIYHDYYAQEEAGDVSIKSEAADVTKLVNSDDTPSHHGVKESHDSIVVNDTVFSPSHDGNQFHSGILHEIPHHITLQSSEVVDGHVSDDRELHHLAEFPFAQLHPGIPVLPTLSEQEKSDLQMLLQNHQMINSLAEANGTVLTLKDSEELPSSPDQETGTDFMDDDYYDVPATNQRGSLYFSVAPSQPYLPSATPSPVPPSEVNYGGSDFGVSHLWNNVQLIPLAPELFDSAADSSEDSLNLTSLFHDAVPISPVEQPKDNSVDIHLNELDVNIEENNSEETFTQEEEIENAKFMAYVLIGACCGLALLSVAGIIVIVRFKKTCGSRQIRTRTRLTDQNSVDGSSRHDGGGNGDGLILGGESGHKLGSWFTGRHEHQIGSGKLRSNMTLPNVHDHKREKNKSGSTRDLLSITSESSNSSCTSSPRQGRGGSGNGDTKVAPAEEEPRGSWLHGEYRASHSDLSLSPAQDLPYIPHHYNGRDPHGHPSSARSTHPSNSTHQQDTFRYRTESSMESEELQQRSSRERRYTGGKEDHERSTSGRRPRYVVSSLESEELDDRLRRREHVHSTTDSEAEDRTTHYDEDEESHDPSCYTGHSRELDETVISRGNVPPTSMTSQELGDHLSRDLKQYQSHRNRQHEEDTQEEVEEGIDRQELRRSQSQVSFSRDNVQNEVFLEFDNIFRQHGQYLSGDPLPPASTLGRVSRGTTDTLLSVSRANTPDSIDMSHHQSLGRHRYHHGHGSTQAPSPPTTPPRFSPPPAPPRPPKPGHLSQPGTPSPKAERGRLAAEEAPRHQRSSASNNNDGERLI